MFYQKKHFGGVQMPYKQGLRAFQTIHKCFSNPLQTLYKCFARSFKHFANAWQMVFKVLQTLCKRLKMLARVKFKRGKIMKKTTFISDVKKFADP